VMVMPGYSVVESEKHAHIVMVMPGYSVVESEKRGSCLDARV